VSKSRQRQAGRDGRQWLSEDSAFQRQGRTRHSRPHHGQFRKAEVFTRHAGTPENAAGPPVARSRQSTQRALKCAGWPYGKEDRRNGNAAGPGTAKAEFLEGCVRWDLWWEKRLAADYTDYADLIL